MASHSEYWGNSLLSRLWRLKSLGTGRFLAVFLMRTTDARRLWTRAGAKTRGTDVADGRAAGASCVRLSLAIEARHRSRGAMSSGGR